MATPISRFESYDPEDFQAKIRTWLKEQLDAATVFIKSKKANSDVEVELRLMYLGSTEYQRIVNWLNTNTEYSTTFDETHSIDYTYNAQLVPETEQEETKKKPKQSKVEQQEETKKKNRQALSTEEQEEEAKKKIRQRYTKFSDTEDIIKITKERLKDVDNADFDIRLSVSTETTPILETELDEKDLKANASSIRDKKRQSWNFNNLFRIDMTQVTNLSRIRFKKDVQDKISYDFECEMEFISLSDDSSTLAQEVLVKLITLRQNSRLPYSYVNLRNMIKELNLVLSLNLRKLDNIKAGVDYKFMTPARNLKFPDVVTGGLIGGKTTYNVTIKVDGERKQLLFYGGAVFLMYPPYDFNLILVDWKKTGSFHGVMVDGENVPMQNRIEPCEIKSEYLYIPFDCCMYPINKILSKSIQQKPHNDRMEVVIRTLEKKLPFLEEHGLYIMYKDFIKVGNTFETMSDAVSSVSKMDPCFKTDGMMFTPINADYNSLGENFPIHERILTKHPEVCKLKPPDKLTMDLFIDISKEPHIALGRGVENELAVFTGSYRNAFDATKDIDWSNTFWQTFKTSGIVELEPKFRIEIKDKKEIKINYLSPLKARPDKSQPNRTDYAGAIWDDINDPLGQDTLEGKTFRLLRHSFNKIKKSLYHSIPEGADIFEIGTGNGGQLYRWNRFTHILGVEISDKHIDEMNKRLDNYDKNPIDNPKLSKLVRSPLKPRVNVLNKKAEDTQAILREAERWFGWKDEIRPFYIVSMLSLSFFWKNTTIFNNLMATLQGLTKLYRQYGGDDVTFVYMTIRGSSVKELFLDVEGENIKKLDLGPCHMQFHEQKKEDELTSMLEVKIDNSIVNQDDDYQQEYLVSISDLTKYVPFSEMTEPESADIEECMSINERIYAKLFVSGTTSIGEITDSMPQKVNTPAKHKKKTSQTKQITESKPKITSPPKQKETSLVEEKQVPPKQKETSLVKGKSKREETPLVEEKQVPAEEKLTRSKQKEILNQSKPKEIHLVKERRTPVKVKLTQPQSKETSPIAQKQTPIKIKPKETSPVAQKQLEKENQDISVTEENQLQFKEESKVKSPKDIPPKQMSTPSVVESQPVKLHVKLSSTVNRIDFRFQGRGDFLTSRWINLPRYHQVAGPVPIIETPDTAKETAPYIQNQFGTANIDDKLIEYQSLGVLSLDAMDDQHTFAFKHEGEQGGVVRSVYSLVHAILLCSNPEYQQLTDEKKQYEECVKMYDHALNALSEKTIFKSKIALALNPLVKGWLPRLELERLAYRFLYRNNFISKAELGEITDEGLAQDVKEYKKEKRDFYGEMKGLAQFKKDYPTQYNGYFIIKTVYTGKDFKQKEPKPLGRPYMYIFHDQKTVTMEAVSKEEVKAMTPFLTEGIEVPVNPITITNYRYKWIGEDPSVTNHVEYLESLTNDFYHKRLLKEDNINIESIFYNCRGGYLFRFYHSRGKNLPELKKTLTLYGNIVAIVNAKGKSANQDEQFYTQSVQFAFLADVFKLNIKAFAVPDNESVNGCFGTHIPDPKIKITTPDQVGKLILNPALKGKVNQSDCISRRVYCSVQPEYSFFTTTDPEDKSSEDKNVEYYTRRWTEAKVGHYDNMLNHPDIKGNQHLLEYWGGLGSAQWGNRANPEMSVPSIHLYYHHFEVTKTGTISVELANNKKEYIPIWGSKDIHNGGNPAEPEFIDGIYVPLGQVNENREIVTVFKS